MKTTFTLLISCLLSFLLLGAGSVSASEPSASMIIADIEAAPGEEVVIPITVEGFEKVNLIQIYLYFNKSVTKCVSVENLHPDISNAMTNINDSLFMLSWYHTSRSASIPDGGKLLDLRFDFCTDAVGCEDNGSYTDLFFIPSHTFITGPGPEFDVIPLNLDHGSISAMDMSVVYLDLNLNVTGDGKVMVDGNDYSGPVTVEAGTTLSLDAIPGGDWTFEGWSGDLGGSQSSVNILMDSDKTVSAAFAEVETPDPVAVTFNLTDQHDAAITGAVVTFNGSTNPAGKYTFEEISAGTYDYKVVKTGYQTHSGKVEVKEEDVNKHIVLEEQSYAVDFKVTNGNGGMHAQAGGASIASGDQVQEGLDVRFTADPADGYTVKEWRINGKVVSGNTNTALTVKDLDKNINVTVEFVLPTYRLTVLAEPEEGGSVEITPERTRYEAGEEVTLRASAADSYQFVYWKGVDGKIRSTKASYIHTISPQNETLTAVFETAGYDISTTASPRAGGTLSGSGSYTHGEEVTVGAVPADGYYFVNWTENGGEVTGEKSFSFTAAKDRKLVANFGRYTYDVAFDIRDDHGETIEGATVTLAGRENSPGDYTFRDIPFGSHPYKVEKTGFPSFEGELELKENHTEIVNLGIQTFAVDFGVDGSNGSVKAQVNGEEILSGDIVHQGQDVKFIAEPEEDYQVSQWTLNGEAVPGQTDNQFVLEALSGNASVGVRFEDVLYGLTVVVEPEGAGNVGVDPNLAHYKAGDKLNLSATAGDGYDFLHWVASIEEKVESTEASFSYVMPNQDVTMKAVFEIRTYDITLTVMPEGGGFRVGEGTYDHGERVTAEAIPATGYTFVNWTEEGTEVSTEATYVFTAEGDRDLEAHFEKKTYAVDFGVDGEGGTLTARVDGTTIAAGDFIQSGGQVSFEAVADAHYRVDSWTLNGETVNSHTENTFLIDDIKDDVSVQVSFSSVNYKLTLNVEPAEAGRASVNPDRTYFNAGEEILSAAEAETGYDFVHWTASGEKVESTEASFNFTMPGKDVELTAVFELRTYQIDATVASDQGGEVSGYGEFSHGEEVTLTATPSFDYRFERWTEDGAEVSTEASYQFIAEDDRVFKAEFTPLTWQLSFQVQCTEGNEISDAVVTLDGETFREGQYEFDGLLSGDYDYTIQREGYATRDGSVSLNGENVAKAIGLEPNAEPEPPVDEVEPFEMKVYPNPASEYVWVEFNSENTTAATLILYNMEGRIVRQEQINQTGNIQARLEVYGLTPGIYMLTIHGERSYPVQRLVIR